MRVLVFKCARCEHREEVPGKWGQQPPAPLHCGQPMKRDYRAESAVATFKGDGWARQNP